ncbi:hypothetical protein NQZ68_041900 [Dissostichus eleginoides]|nr:hypothetical protein NQZ68_041900 [Dissostichus eleginoides]
MDDGCETQRQEERTLVSSDSAYGSSAVDTDTEDGQTPTSNPFPYNEDLTHKSADKRQRGREGGAGGWVGGVGDKCQQGGKHLLLRSSGLDACTAAPEEAITMATSRPIDAHTILVGDSGVGKTSLLVQFDQGKFLPGSFTATVGIGFTHHLWRMSRPAVRLTPTAVIGHNVSLKHCRVPTSSRSVNHLPTPGCREMFPPVCHHRFVDCWWM